MGNLAGPPFRLVFWMVLLVALLLFGLLQSLANSGVRLRCGMILLLQGQDGQVQNILAFLTSNSNSPVGDVPPMTSHEVFHCHGNRGHFIGFF